MSGLFDGTFGTIFYFIVALGVIVSIHEYGHYITGRVCGVHAEVFSLGFGPILFSIIDKKGTRWQLALIPLGGYVKFLDNTLETRNNSSHNQVGLYNTSLSRRAAIIVAGPVFNFILSIIIFSSIFQYSGNVSNSTVIGAVKNVPGLNGAFKEGDRIIELEGHDVVELSRFFKIATEIKPQEFVTYKIKRDNEILTIKSIFPFLPLVEKLQPKSAAIAAGLRIGDLIVELDDIPVYSLSTVQSLVNASEGTPVMLKVLRNQELIKILVEPRSVDVPFENTFIKKWLIGFSGGLFFEPLRIEALLGESLLKGVKQTWNIVTSSIVGLYSIISGVISSCNLQGPIGIAEVSGDIARQGFVDYVWFIGVMSTAIGFLNLLPIPILDGGHLTFIVYEALFKKPVNSKVLKVFMIGGLIFLIGLMFFALTNDLFC